MSAVVQSDIVDELQHKLKLWFNMSVFCDWSHWIVGVLGISFSALSAAKYINNEWASGFAVAATICFGIIGFANPQKFASRYIRAYRILDSALREYRFNELDKKGLLAEHRRAEEILNDVDFSKVPSPPVR